MLTDHRVRSSIDLAATATADRAQRVEASDQAVQLDAVQAQAAEGMQHAAEAYRRGDKVVALNLLDNIRELFGDSAQALAGNATVTSIGESRAAIANSQGFDSNEAKKLVGKSMVSFGQNNAP